MTRTLAFVLAAARKDLLRRRSDPYALLLWLVLPLVIGTLLGSISSGGGKPRGKLLVADLDESLLSRGVATAFAQKPLAEFFDVETVEEAAGRARMDEGDASALLVIPTGFAAALLRDEPARLELLKNPSQKILPAMAEETLELLTEAVFYLQRVAGDRLRDALERVAEGLDSGAETWTDAFVADFSVEIRRSVERLEAYLSPPVLEVDVVGKKESPAPGQGFGTIFFPSMLFMTLFFMAQGLSEDIWSERKEGTLRRAIACPQSIQAFLAGKFVSAAALLLLVAILGLSIGAQIFGFPWANAPLAALWVAGAGLVLTALMTLIQLFASSQRAGNLLTNTIVFPLTMLGGAFFPFEAMPAWMAAIGKRTPNGWALEELKAILFDRASAGEIGAGFLALGLAFLVLLAACASRFSGAFARA